MRALASVFVGLAACLVAAQAAADSDAPAIVIPGKPGVPVIINGVDVSYGVVEGDWGLARPGHVAPTIVTAPLFFPVQGYSRGYYPTVGRRPGYGRFEIEPPPNRRLPPRAPSYYREWSTRSDPLPATIDPPIDAPPLIIAPEINVRKRMSRRNHH